MTDLQQKISIMTDGHDDIPLTEKVLASPLPWRMEQDDKTDNFVIFDRDRRLVANEIHNEDDAILIVKLVNYFNYFVRTEEKKE